MKNLRAHNFTLMEILVAVAVLVILMGFILQFTNSAQRLWAANTAITDMSAQAEAVFSILQQDIEHMYVVTEEEDIDAQGGWLFRPDPNTSIYTEGAQRPLLDLCLLTESPATGQGNSTAIYPVRYEYDRNGNPDEGTGILYRYFEAGNCWEKISEDYENAGNGDTPDWYATPPGNSALKKEFILAEHIKSIRMVSDAFMKDNGDPIDFSKPIRRRPAFIRVDIVFTVPPNLRGGRGTSPEGSTDRTFSKVFLLN